jgi:3-oxoacyl-[acyl-carrier protein] reductase
MAAPDKKLTDKVAIITGASGGIGRVVAKRLATDGFAVVVQSLVDGTRLRDHEHDITKGNRVPFALVPWNHRTSVN